MLQLVYRSVVRLVSTLHDIEILIESWKYLADFLIINPRSGLKGNPLILGIPWIATADAYIGCLKGNMTITRGGFTKKSSYIL
jgi:hypothetical protein